MDMDTRTKGEYTLALFRILVGWIFLAAFIDKIFGTGFQTPPGGGFIDGVSPSSYVSYVTTGLLADFYKSIAGNLAMDILLVAALLILGVTAILGIASKLTTIGSVLFLVIMYTIQLPPVDNPIIDHRIIMAVGMVAVYLLGGYERLSIHAKWKESFLVKKLPILE